MLGYLSLIFCCQLAGELLVAATGLPLPGPVIGMVILFTGLLAKGSLPQDLAAVGDALLTNLSLLFVPAGVGVMLHGSLLGRDWLPITVALLGSTALTIIVTGMLMARLSSGASPSTNEKSSRDQP
jgi:putative effector of murein hydrolase LrgA (UPF0299 family)